MTTMDKKLHLEELEKVTGGAQPTEEKPEVTPDGKVVTSKEKKRKKINIPKPTDT